MIKKIIEWFRSLFNPRAPEPLPVPSKEEIPPPPSWYIRLYSKAHSQLGQKEVFGSDDNPQIVQYFQATNFGKTHDETPWCAAFVNWCLRDINAPRTKSAAAISFMDWGKRLDVPTQGCIVVLTHPNGRHHVGFYDHTEGDYVFLLGGNQANSVCIKGYPRSEVTGFRGFKDEV